MIIQVIINFLSNLLINLTIEEENSEYLYKNGFIVTEQHKGIKIIINDFMEYENSIKYGLFLDRFTVIKPIYDEIVEIREKWIKVKKDGRLGKIIVERRFGELINFYEDSDSFKETTDKYLSDELDNYEISLFLNEFEKTNSKMLMKE
ncbi:MAG: hypothetical protein FWG85_00265 [Bacteroidetes bacterium]|nr:hypothetical protein [Bacteroidota bacterium]